MSCVLRATYPDIVRPSISAVERRDLARSLVTDFAGHCRLDAALLFGSSARGDAQRNSDLDLLLVLNSDAELARLRACMRERRRSGDLRFVSIAAHSWRSLEVLREEDWSFAHHLASEGLPLLDVHDTLISRLAPQRPPDAMIRAELTSRCRELKRYDDLSRFAGDYFFPLLNIYVASKQLIMLANILSGVSEFRRRPAFAVAQGLFPQHADAVAHLLSLAPLYDIGAGRGVKSVPPSVADEHFVATSLQAVREFVDGVV